MAQSSNPVAAWLDAAAAANAATITIMARLFRIQQAIAFGDLTGGREARLMTMEKIIAAQQAQATLAAAMTQMMFFPPTTGAAAQKKITAAHAASRRPYYRKARANARRLTKFR